MVDFQSGLAVADMLFTFMNNRIGGAHIWNLAQPWFGAIQNPDSGRLRPSGLVFKMISPFAGEEYLNASIDNSETITTVADSGNVPSGLSYPVISVSSQGETVLVVEDEASVLRLTERVLHNLGMPC